MSYELLHIVHRTQPYTLNDSNLRRSRPLRRSVSNLLRYSYRSVPQSTPDTPKTKSRACYSLRGSTIWRESSTVLHPFGVCDRRILGLICQGQDLTENVLRELLCNRTLLQRFLVGDSDFRYFEDGRHFEDGELPHHILHFADRDALGGAPNLKSAVVTNVPGRPK